MHDADREDVRPPTHHAHVGYGEKGLAVGRPGKDASASSTSSVKYAGALLQEFVLVLPWALLEARATIRHDRLSPIIGVGGLRLLTASAPGAMRLGSRKRRKTSYFLVT